jgi:Tfp pilus assembly protein PilN
VKVVNLLPKAEQKELRLEIMTAQVRQFWFVVLASFILLILLGIGASLFLQQRIKSNNAEIENKKKVLSSAATKQLEQQVSELNNQIRLVGALKSDHYHWSKALVELTYMVDNDTKLTSVTMDRFTGRVQVYGEAADRESVLAFWSTVKRSSLFSNINFPLTNLEKDLRANFTFTFNVNTQEMKNE